MSAGVRGDRGEGGVADRRAHPGADAPALEPPAQPRAGGDQGEVPAVHALGADHVAEQASSRRVVRLPGAPRAPAVLEQRQRQPPRRLVGPQHAERHVPRVVAALDPQVSERVQVLERGQAQFAAGRDRRRPNSGQ
ncbi:hypothetical protein TH66_16215 [Carbonactinospora thermoautotrophica]|uniref:Uncharacterized protein n=1 Tax=Carbonactinospora thermoautotrophica TaxID=1469144 RepID=A0A132MRA4_9ACTN|nr:hypothetical protein TH66_16215 [Carbonactinospora thermoautotrophica]KWX06216.1 hypothetical protein TR74_22745 [Carbonactinospora thermoautotrophica]